MSSASRWARSAAAAPMIVAGSSAADDDPLVVLDLAEGGPDDVGEPHRAAPLRGGSMPASTSSDSALRRMRVARWSSRKRLASVSGSVSLLLELGDEVELAAEQVLVAAAEVDEESAMLRRSTACSTARSSAESCTC